MTTTDIQPVSRPPFWFRLSVTAGNLLQIAGLVLGSFMMYVAAQPNISTIIRVALMLLGWLIIYVCCHAIAHWIVGRLVGIRFRGYGIRGTDHPESYPSGMREVMSAIPFFTVLTQKATMQSASPIARALMFAAGETSTSVCSVLAGLYVWQSGTPGGLILLMVSVFTAIYATIVTAKGPKGDYASALAVLRRSSQATQHN